MAVENVLAEKAIVWYNEPLASGFLIMITGILLGAIGTIFWHFKKRIWIRLCRINFEIIPTRFNFALSIDFNEGLNSGTYFKELYKHLNSSIIKNGLEKEIRIKDLSDILKFKDEIEAQAYSKRKKLDLIVWGSFTEDGLRSSGQQANELILNFTYRHNETKDKRLGKMIFLDIGSRIARKNYWRIIENESLRDVKIVGQNLSDISLYILGVALKFQGRISESFEIFKSLCTDLISRNDQFIDLVIPHFLNCGGLLISSSVFDKNKYKNGENYCNEILKLVPNNFLALSNLAVLQYRQGRASVASKTVDKLSALYPDIPLTKVDIAFFKILEKKYGDAYESYKKLAKFKVDQLGFNPIELVEFLELAYADCKEPALLFGSGIISLFFGDKIIAKNDLEEFVKHSNEKIYGKMYRRAKKYLSDLAD